MSIYRLNAPLPDYEERLLVAVRLVRASQSSASWEAVRMRAAAECFVLMGDLLAGPGKPLSNNAKAGISLPIGGGFFRSP